MKKLRQFREKPLGQVLLATLLFCFIFVALFVGLYKAGIAYNLKEKSRRGADLTALSAGAVYANGLQLVRYSNALVMFMFAVDIGTMGAAIAPFIPTFPEGIPAAIAAAKKADPNTRGIGHRTQKYIFGIDLSSGISVGVYPLLIELEGHSLAGDNLLKNNFLLPLFFYNFETTKEVKRVVIPDMALRFRNVSELIPDQEQTLYSLKHDGVRHYFTEDQVESGHNPRHPHEMRVRKSLPSSFAGMWVRKENNGKGDGSPELGHLGVLGPTVFKALKVLFKDMQLDVTHRDDPPNHTLALLGQLPGQISNEQVDFTQISEVILEGGGLAAWNIPAPPFQVHLQKVDPTYLPGLGNIPVNISMDFPNFSDSLQVLRGII